jgi:hypothetical protein
MVELELPKLAAWVRFPSPAPKKKSNPKGPRLKNMQGNEADIVKTLIHRIDSFAEGYRQNVAVIGDTALGNISLLKKLLSSGGIREKNVVPVYLETKIEPFEFCAKRFIKAVLFEFTPRELFLEKENDPAFLIEELKKAYPKTAHVCLRVAQDIEKNKFEEAYSFMMDIPSVIYEESGKKCVLILNEFHNLDNFVLKNPFSALAKKIMIQKNIMYVLLSSRNTISQQILNEKLTMLFGNFEKIFLTPFSIDGSRKFLRENIKGTVLPQAYLDFIAAFTGNRVLYMKIICDEIERLISLNKAPADDYNKIVESAFTETIFKRSGIINQRFSNLFFKISEGKLLSKSASALIALSSGNKKQQDIIRSSKLQARDVSRILNMLIKMDIIARNGSFYRFKDNLFCFWVRFVYLKEITAFSLDDAFEENSFRKEIISRINIFMKEFEKEIMSRIVELFGLFKNDIIQLNGKKHKFLSFDDIHMLDDGPSSGSNILAAGGGLKWMCTVKKEYVTENDVVNIIKNVKNRKKDTRINRNIIVSLAGINENAYLLAKEAKMWVWDLESVNVLMEIYGKTWIV